MGEHPSLEQIAANYHKAVHAADKGGIDAEPEAQLTIPFATLLQAVATEAGLRPLQFIRADFYP